MAGPPFRIFMAVVPLGAMVFCITYAWQMCALGAMVFLTPIFISSRCHNALFLVLIFHGRRVPWVPWFYVAIIMAAVCLECHGFLDRFLSLDAARLPCFYYWFIMAGGCHGFM